MSQHDRKTFAVIGAGPKGIAVAVKASVLKEFGFAVDHVILIEKDDIAAHWSGDFGYTNGEMKLGTAPEKDVVFPIETDVGDAVLNTKIHQRLLHFTWTSFLIHTDRYSEWVDRGRHAPSHKVWASYLRWIAKQLEPEVSILFSEVIQIDLTTDKHRWKLTLTSRDKNNYFVEADRLMLTGPGKTCIDFVAENDNALLPPVYDLESFWYGLKNKTFSTKSKLAIIGAGENAASALLALSQYAPTLQAHVISPKGFLFSRAENYYENQIFSQPTKNNWSSIDIADRIDFIKRTDLSVFSQHAMTILNEQIRHRIIPGRVSYLKRYEKAVALSIVNQQQTTIHCYDQVILATGFNQITAMKTLMTPRVQTELKKALGAPITQQTLLSKIQYDLSVEKMQPRLHLPMLASVMQGPGFSNLSCLGLLSDRVFSIKNHLKNGQSHPIH